MSTLHDLTLVISRFQEARDNLFQEERLIRSQIVQPEWFSKKSVCVLPCPDHLPVALSPDLT